MAVKVPAVPKSKRVAEQIVAFSRLSISEAFEDLSNTVYDLRGSEKNGESLRLRTENPLSFLRKPCWEPDSIGAGVESR